MAQLLKHNNINWDIVQKILHDSDGGRVIDPFIDEKFPENERQVALLALQEKQLLTISRGLQFISYSAGTSSKAEIKKYLKQAYVELERESKYELLPLFFSPDMLTSNSLYIDDASTRDEAFKAYKSLTEGDGLSLSNLKKNYMEFQYFAYLLPIQNHLPKPVGIEPGKNVEQNAGTPAQKKQKQGPSSVKEMKTQIIGNIKVIAAPQRAYFKRTTIVEYKFGLGELIEAETVFLRFVDENESISIKTSKPAVINRLFLNDGEKISASGQNICEITELNHYDYRQLLEESKKRNRDVRSKEQNDHLSPASQSSSKPRTVENRLKDLKKLYAQKLITKTVYEKKQDEILADL